MRALVTMESKRDRSPCARSASVNRVYFKDQAAPYFHPSYVPALTFPLPPSTTSLSFLFLHSHPAASPLPLIINPLSFPLSHTVPPPFLYFFALSFFGGWPAALRRPFPSQSTVFERRGYGAPQRGLRSGERVWRRDMGIGSPLGRWKR